MYEAVSGCYRVRGAGPRAGVELRERAYRHIVASFRQGLKTKHSGKVGAGMEVILLDRARNLEGPRDCKARWRMSEANL